MASLADAGGTTIASPMACPAAIRDLPQTTLMHGETLRSPAQASPSPPGRLEVPGGKWHTVTSRPASAANRASSVFHARTR
jgi:hypothetical protein